MDDNRIQDSINRVHIDTQDYHFKFDSQKLMHTIQSPNIHPSQKSHYLHFIEWVLSFVMYIHAILKSNFERGIQVQGPCTWYTTVGTAQTHGIPWYTCTVYYAT